MKATGEGDPITISLSKATARYGPSRSFWRKLIARGELKPIFLSEQKMLLRVADIERLMDEKTRQVAAGADAA